MSADGVRTPNARAGPVMTHEPGTPPPASECSPSPTPRTTNPAPWSPGGSGQLADWIDQRRLGPGDLLFATRDGTPISRNTFRTRIWRPAVKTSGVDFDVRVHDLRHAHASWLLAGGSDLKSVMDRMGHAQITTTQKYLHTLPDADAKNLDALNRTRGQHRGAGNDDQPDTDPPAHAHGDNS